MISRNRVSGLDGPLHFRKDGRHFQQALENVKMQELGAVRLMAPTRFVTEGPPLSFTGSVVRIEADGFGIIKFDGAIGPSANTFGVSHKLNNQLFLHSVSCILE